MEIGIKYIGVIQCNKMKNAEMKEKLKEEYFCRLKKI